MTHRNSVMEDEMVRLAEEMSLMDEFDLQFNPHDLRQAKERLRMYEDILDEQLGLRDRDNDLYDPDGRVSESQLKTLFGTHDEDFFYPSSSKRTPSLKPNRTSRGKMKDTLSSISKSLKWYQTKILNEIENSSEGKDLAALLELNDRVSSSLTKTDWLAQAEVGQTSDNLLSYSPPSSFLEGSSPLHDQDRKSSEHFDAMIHSAVYAVRRGAQREEISTAVEDLMRLGNFSASVSLPAVKQMTAAGALQALLTTLGRASEWPDVELKLSKVISVLVTHEDDWALLKRSAMVILTSLYTLELKTQTRARTVSEAAQMQPGNMAHPGFPLGYAELAANVSPQQQASDIRSFAAAAVAKLALVLASEWSVHPFPFGDVSLLGLGLNSGVASSTLSFMQSAAYDHAHTPGKPSRRAATKSKEPSPNPVVDANRTLDVLLNLILTMSEASLACIYIPKSSDMLADLFAPAKAPGVPTLNRQNSKDVSVGLGMSSSLTLPANCGDQQREPLTLMLQSDLDSFLRDYLGLDVGNLTSGDMANCFVKCPVDRGAVLCSSALATLAEVPQCRPGLVSGGALRVLRAWLELGAYVMQHIYILCKHVQEFYIYDSSFQQRVMSLFSPTFDLISNACAALMYLTGGTDGRFNSVSHTSSMLGGGRDYVVGWIDAQILAEGLPEVLVRLVLTSHDSFLLEGGQGGSFRSVLPGVIAMYVSQTMYQLCSRAQNRQRLQGNIVPWAMCAVFESTALHVRGSVMGDAHDFDEDDLEGEGSMEQKTMFQALFEHGGLLVSNNANHDTDSPGGPPHSPFPHGTSPRDRDGSGDFIASPPAKSPFIMKPSTPHFNPSMSTYMSVVSSITSSALDTLTYYFADEAQRAQFPAVTGVATQLPSQHSSNGMALDGNNSSTFDLSMSVSSFASQGNTQSSAFVHYVFIPRGSLLEMMCHPSLIAALSLATSYLPKGHGRLACVRAISALTDRLESMASLYDGNVMDVLVWIASEAEELTTPPRPVPPPHESSTLFSSFFTNGNTKLSLERGTSNNSTISGISSRTGGTSFRSRSRSGHVREPYAVAPDQVSQQGDDEDAMLEVQKMAMEETLAVCYALANCCHARDMYALRMYVHGLFTIMTRLAQSEHMEITRQALRCMHAMCRVLATIDQASPMPPPSAGTSAKFPSTPAGSTTTPSTGNAASGNLSDSKESILNSAKHIKHDYLISALDVLNANLRSPSVLVQKECIYTLSQLVCISNDLQDRIVDGCLRTVVSILLDPSNDRDVRSAAEDVIRNLGFGYGLKDLEICGFDFEILRDWYNLRRSLTPQRKGLEIVRDWVHRLFVDDEALYSSSTPIPGDLLLQNYLDDNDDVFQLLHEAAKSLHTEVEHSDRPGYLRDDDQHKQTTSSGLGFPSLQRHLTDSFLKLLPFCAPKNLFDSSSHHEEDHSYHSNSSHHSRGSASGRHAFSTGNTPHTQGHIHVSNQRISRGAVVCAGHTKVENTWDGYRWIDRVPIAATHLQDLFYSSKMHQLLLTDLTSLGVPYVYTPQGHNAGGEEEVAFLIPHPHPIHAVLLPTRSYQSFVRVGRMLERLFECVPSAKLWALSFKNSDFHGDFHTSLLYMLQRCPHICSLTFASNVIVEEDALLGHLIGQIPSSVRFVSFKNCLSKESIQAMCILLRRHNEAFTGDYAFGGQPFGRASESFRGSDSYRGSDSGKTPTAPTSAAYPSVSSQDSKGLLGLALTHMNLESTELEHVLELLVPRSYTPATGTPTGSTKAAFASTYSGTPNSGKLARPPSTPPPHSLHPPHPSTPTSYPLLHHQARGLKFLDLSHNRLSDSQCTAVLCAALSGALEGLELGGNWIYRGVKFIEAVDMLNPDNKRFFSPDNKLRYLGLSQNNLTHRALTSILHKLASNTSLTSLDLSANGVDSSASINDLLRTFLKKNAGLRVLDLSYNKLSAETCKEMELGLLQNHSLLLLPLAGNSALRFCKTVDLIQRKLRENRMLYRHQSHLDPFIYNHIYAYLEEDETRLSTASEVEEGAAGMAGVVHLPTAEAVMLPSAMPTVLAEVGESKGEMLTASMVSSGTVGPGTSARAMAKASPSFADPRQEDMPSGVPAATTTIPAPAPVTAAQAVVPRSHAVPPSQYPFASTAVTAMLEPAEPKHIGLASAAEFKPEARSEPGEHHHLVAASAAITITATTTTTSSTVGSLTSSASAASSIAHAPAPAMAVPHFSLNTLHVLFSAPLAGFDRNAKAHALEVLDYSAERDSLCQVFKEVHRDVCVHFDFATTDSLRTVLSFGCRALHFSGHGLPNGLCFEDGRAGLQVIKVQQLKDLLGAGGLTLEFVFVSACYSKEIGQAFIKAGVPHVVCVKVDSKIQDAAAIAFTRAFYVALLSGRTVKASFDIAKEALKASPYVPNSLLEGEKFVLLPDANDLGDELPAGVGAGGRDLASLLHSKAIFHARGVSDWPMPGQCTVGPNRIDGDMFLSRSRLPSPPADFEGREVVMNTLIRHIMDRRLVSLVGEDGMGKSAVAAAVCKYLYDREVFGDYIVYLRAKGVRDFPAFVSALKASLFKYAPGSIRAKLSDLQQQAPGAPGPAGRGLIHEEEMVISALSDCKMLLVMDNLDELLGDYGDNVTDMRLFLGRLFEQCAQIKVLHVSVDTLSMRNINVGFGIIEYSVHLGPLTLTSSLRLFARLAPSLSTAHDKHSFIEALQPAKHLHATVHSREVNNTVLQILSLLGDGNPSKIVHMACESNAESVEALKSAGMRIIRHYMPDVHAHAGP